MMTARAGMPLHPDAQSVEIQNFQGRPLFASIGGVVNQGLSGRGCPGVVRLSLPSETDCRDFSMSRAQSLLAELQGAPRPKGSSMSKETIASLRLSKNRMRAALDKIAVHAESFAVETEVMADVSGNTFAGAGEAMKAVVAEVMEVREIFDLDAKSNGGPPLDSPTVAPAKGSGAPGSQSVKTEITALGPVHRVTDNG